MTREGLLARADRYVESAQLLLEHGDYESSISRAYYAMFYAAEAALLAKGLAFSTHRGVAGAFGEHFAKTGLVPRALGRDLSRALEKRLVSDYSPERAMTRAEAEELTRSARTFVDAVRSLA